MKYSIILALMLAIQLTSTGQTLFLDEMAGHRWEIKDFSGLEALRQAPSIDFYVRRLQPDSVATTATTCFFGSQLLIRQYDPRQSRVVTLAAYPYRTDRERCTLTIFFDSKTAITYAMAITSTGSSASLYRQRKQKKPTS